MRLSFRGKIKLVGEESSLILYVNEAEVEARTHENCLAVASSPCSPRASTFHKVRDYDRKHSRLRRYQAHLPYSSEQKRAS